MFGYFCMYMYVGVLLVIVILFSFQQDWLHKNNHRI